MIAFWGLGVCKISTGTPALGTDSTEGKEVKGATQNETQPTCQLEHMAQLSSL